MLLSGNVAVLMDVETRSMGRLLGLVRDTRRRQHRMVPGRCLGARNSGIPFSLCPVTELGFTGFLITLTEK